MHGKCPCREMIAKVSMSEVPTMKKESDERMGGGQVMKMRMLLVMALLAGCEAKP